MLLNGCSQQQHRSITRALIVSGFTLDFELPHHSILTVASFIPFSSTPLVCTELYYFSRRALSRIHHFVSHSYPVLSCIQFLLYSDESEAITEHTHFCIRSANIRAILHAIYVHLCSVTRAVFLSLSLVVELPLR